MSTWASGDKIQAKRGDATGTVRNVHDSGFGVKLGIDWSDGRWSIVSEDSVTLMERAPLPCAKWCRMCEDIQYYGELEPCSVCPDCNTSLGVALDYRL